MKLLPIICGAYSTRIESLYGKTRRLAACDAHEIAINRNATEALNTVVYGPSLAKGDEVIGTKQDYPNMINA